MPKVTVHRKAHFNAAHRLYRKDWSDAKNIEVFSKCSNPNFHGHNYELIVSLTGEIDKETGYVYDLGILKNLNIEVPEFKDLNPTAENICVVTFQKLRKHLPTDLDLKITLYETPRNFVSYSGE